MIDEEIQFAVRLSRVAISERKAMVQRTMTSSSFSGALARDVFDALLGKPNPGRAADAWVSLVRRMGQTLEEPNHELQKA